MVKQSGAGKGGKWTIAVSLLRKRGDVPFAFHLSMKTEGVVARISRCLVPSCFRLRSSVILSLSSVLWMLSHDTSMDSWRHEECELCCHQACLQGNGASCTATCHSAFFTRNQAAGRMQIKQHVAAMYPGTWTYV